LPFLYKTLAALCCDIDKKSGHTPREERVGKLLLKAIEIDDGVNTAVEQWLIEHNADL
jgi:hypothetical protein